MISKWNHKMYLMLNGLFLFLVIKSMQKTLKTSVKSKKQYITLSSLKVNIQLKPGEINFR